MNRCEAEIDAIRVKLYEENKHLTKEQQDKRIRDKGQKLAAQYGFTIIPAVSEYEKKDSQMAI